MIVKPFYILDDTGVYVQSTGLAPALGSNQIELPEGTDPFQYQNSYLVNGTLTPRPASPSPVSITGGWRVGDCPENTRVIVWDSLSGEALLDTTTDSVTVDVDFSLPDSGTYSVEVESPLPHYNTTTEIVVP